MYVRGKRLQKGSTHSSSSALQQRRTDGRRHTRETTETGACDYTGSGWKGRRNEKGGKIVVNFLLYVEYFCCCGRGMQTWRLCTVFHSKLQFQITNPFICLVYQMYQSTNTSSQVPILHVTTLLTWEALSTILGQWPKPFVIAAVVSIELRRTSDWTTRITELSICRLLSYNIFVVWENNPSPCGYCISPSMVFVVWENIRVVVVRKEVRWSEFSCWNQVESS